jgi:hypothetical protein
VAASDWFIHPLLRASLALLSACYVPVAEQCPSCPTLSAVPLALSPSTRAVVVLVPGILGYGWEWNGAQVALAADPTLLAVTWDWQPWNSLAHSARQLAQHLQALDDHLPLPVRLVVLAHSAAGLVAVEAASHLRVRREVELWTVGSPFAGMGLGVAPPDLSHSPFAIALGSAFTFWPPLPPRVRLRIFQTRADDPVMRVRLGHDPGNRASLPRPAQLTWLPREVGHNVALGWICERLVASLRDP